METIFYWTGAIILFVASIFAVVYFAAFCLDFFFNHVYKDRSILRNVISYARYKTRFKEYLKYKDEELSKESLNSLIDVICQNIENDSQVQKDYDLDNVYGRLSDQTKQYIYDEINEAFRLKKEGYAYR